MYCMAASELKRDLISVVVGQFLGCHRFIPGQSSRGIASGLS
jgi:hypothetical protein